MTAQSVEALADLLSSIDAEWRKQNGYTGRPVHRKAYWKNMAAVLLSEGLKSLAKTRKP